MSRGHVAGLLVAIVVGGRGIPAEAQNSSLFRQTAPRGEAQQATLPQVSWTYLASPPPKKVELHDIVVVRVDELARMTSDGEISRRKNLNYNAQLKDWLEWPSLFTIKPALQSNGDPRVQGQVQQQQRNTSEMETRESLALNIACEIVDMRPNGLFVLEGHKRIGVNEENWEVSLSGLCRREDVGPDNTVLSRNLLGLQLEKRDRGSVRDGYKRGWFTRWFDQFDPF